MRKTLTLALALVTLALALIAPAFRGSKVLAQPVTQTIILNTGFDQWLAPPALIPIGQKDNEWRVITDSVNGVPNPLLATGRPADVVSNATWGVFQDANFPNSRWISVTPAQGAPVPTPPPSGPFNEFQYAFYFTLPVGVSSPVLTMKLSADDHITKVTLNSHTLFQGSGGIFINPPLMNATFTSPPVPADFLSGPNVNVITVDVEDTAGAITGLIVDGTVTYVDCDRSAVKDIGTGTFAVGGGGVDSITFWEASGGPPTPHTFAAMGPELTTKLSGTLSSTNTDFEGVPGEEFYDVFYSKWDGTFDSSGQFVTIEAEWDRGAPSGGGLNISRVDLNFPVIGPMFANSVMTFVALGDNALPSNIGKAVDSDNSVPPLTTTTMGNTVGQTQRLRITLGFPCGGSTVCLQDDSNSSIVFLGDTVTGAYRFCCGGTTFNGVAQVTKKGNTVTFQHYTSDRRMLAQFDGAGFKGSVALQTPPGVMKCTILDRDTRNNSCICQ